MADATASESLPDPAAEKFTGRRIGLLLGRQPEVHVTIAV
jgi:hypothetical protein